MAEPERAQGRRLIFWIGAAVSLIAAALAGIYAVAGGDWRAAVFCCGLVLLAATQYRMAVMTPEPTGSRRLVVELALLVGVLEVLAFSSPGVVGALGFQVGAFVFAGALAVAIRAWRNETRAAHQRKP